MSIEQVKQLSYEMRLLGIHAAFERRAAEALEGQMHPTEFLLLLLQDEHLARKDRAAKALTTRAKFRSHADVEDFDMTFDRGLSKAKLKTLAQLSFLHRKENLILLGKTGEGKTHLATALGRKACAEGHRTLFMSVNFLFEEITAQKAAGKYLPFVRRLTKTDILILDDFGLRAYLHEEATALIDILEERYQKGATIITSQVDIPGWKKLFEDPVVAEAAIDRMKNPAQKLVLKGGSYRARLK